LWKIGGKNMALMNEQATDTNDGDYLVAEQDQNVLKNLSEMGEHLRSLKVKLLEAETRHEEAKKEYEYYASSVLPMAMYNAGVDSIGLATGGTLTLDRKFRCTPNKNAEDRAIQAAWLRQHNLGSLINESALVAGAKIEQLKQSDIPFVEVDEINTNKVKAAIVDLLGMKKGSVAQIQLSDVPDCFHFQEVTECSIKL
jgi:hypothetical protein